MTITLSNEQFKELMADQEFRKEFAREQARMAHDALVEEFGGCIGKAFPIPVPMAIRLSGFNDKWIRRNIPLIKVEGQHDAIAYGDLIEAITKTKVG
ncbi:MAG: hypothetical protein ACQKBY_09830 [Verrucomicrobiales bacterium]